MRMQAKSIREKITPIETSTDATKLIRLKLNKSPH